MKLTILGNEGPFPTAGGATTSYLLEVAGKRILMDLGSGTLARLLEYVDSIDDLDVLILSHLHYDHISDISVLKYMSEIGKKMGRVKKTLKLYAPESPEAEFKNLAYEDAFEINVISESTSILLDECKISFSEMVHPVQSFAICVEGEDKKFVYSSDTSYAEKLIDFAKKADFLLCECCHYKDEKSEEIVHLRSDQVGEIASKSKVDQLMITHFVPGMVSEKLVKEVAESFKGKLSCSEQLKSYYI